jgi:hypothetical protein
LGTLEGYFSVLFMGRNLFILLFLEESESKIVEGMPIRFFVSFLFKKGR